MEDKIIYTGKVLNIECGSYKNYSYLGGIVLTGDLHTFNLLKKAKNEGYKLIMRVKNE